MTWAPLLLADPSACLRRRVLVDLLGRGPDDAEVQELAGVGAAGVASDPLVADLLALQGADGSWQAGDGAWQAHVGPVRTTALALTRLGYLGLCPEHEAVRRGADYLFASQRRDGAWDLHEPLELLDGDAGYTMVPLQTAIPLRALAACGYAADPRAERGYEWLLAQRLQDGAWPTGIAAGNYGRVAGYRRLPHSRWGCRSNTTGALICLALHPERRREEPARRALDLLLGCEMREQRTMGFEVARLLGLEPAGGNLTFYAHFDLALVLELCWRCGATLDDDRVAGLVAHVRALQGPFGLWEGARLQATRWVTFDLLRSMARIDTGGDWLSREPPTPFQPYLRRPRRY